jgi:ribosome-binding factor A
MSQRTERVDHLLRQEIGALLSKEIADPRIGFATITDVETSPDLRHAKVWVSVIGTPADRAETVRALQRSMGYVRHELGRRLRIRRIPELHVQLDDSATRGTRVLHVLQELEAGVDPEAITTPDDTLPTPVPRLPHEGDADDAGDAGDVGDVGAGATAARPGEPAEPRVRPGSPPMTRHGRDGGRPGRGGPSQAARRPGGRRAAGRDPGRGRR